MQHKKLLYLIISIFCANLYAQERVMTIHLNNGIYHQYKFQDVDSVSFVEIAEVLPTVAEGTQMMTSDMLNDTECADFYSLTDHYLKAKEKNIYERVFGNSVTGQYALMPLSKEKMVMLYGGGK